MITISSFDEFNEYLGKDMGQSQILKVTQEQIDKLASVVAEPPVREVYEVSVWQV